MIPPLHFGGPKGKSAEDAILCATHDIQAAHNHGLAMSSLTFDISGFFNNVSHPVLITKLCEFRVPLPMVKWTASFVSDRQTAMCLDGKRGKLQPTETGLPQGSPTSPILTSIYTASLTQTTRGNGMSITRTRNSTEYSQGQGNTGKPHYIC